MANAEQLEKLHQGPQAWNTYVKTQPSNFRADLAEADLSGADLRGADLRGAKLGGAKLREADLSGADLREADLREADLRGAKLGGADLREADLREANLIIADLSRANLNEAKLAEAGLAFADLSGANFLGATYNNLTVWPPGFDPKGAGADRFDPEKAGASLEDVDGSGTLAKPYFAPIEEPKLLIESIGVPAVEVRSVRELVEIVPNPEPSQQDIEAAQRETEKLVGQAQHFVHEGTWKDRPDLEHDVEFLIRALREELSSVVDRTPSIGVVQTYGSRLSQYLLGIETSELDKTGEKQAAIEARQFSDEILTGLEDATDTNAALESADWIAEHLKLPPQQDNEPAAELDNSYATVTDAVAWTQQASTLLSTGANVAQVTGLLGGSVGFVLGPSFNVDPGTAAGVGAMIGGVVGLICTVVDFILAMLKANFKTKD